jgi:alpha-1,3-rhamnosyltransferase
VVVGQNKIMDGDGRICFWDKDRNNVYSEEAAKWRSFNEYLHEVTGIDQFGSEFGTYASFSRANHVANGYLIRKSVLDKVLPFTKDAPLEDYWLHLQLSKLTLYNSIDTSTFVYRWHASNTIKQQERIHQFWYDTLLWEVRNNERRGGKWKRLYRDIEVDRKCQWSLMGVRCERVRGLFYKWRELYICGLHFVLMKRMIDKRRNSR